MTRRESVHSIPIDTMGVVWIVSLRAGPVGYPNGSSAYCRGKSQAHVNGGAVAPGEDSRM